VRSVIAIALFMLGVYFSIRVIAALHRIVDLWYTIRTAWWKVCRGILGWGGGTVAIAALLPDRYRTAFLWGLAAFLLIYLGAFVLWHLIVPRMASRRAAS